MINAITLSRALNLFYSRRWSNHLVHLIYGNWLSCKRINSQSSVAPSVSQVRLRFPVRKGVLSFLSSGDCVTLCLPGGIPRPREQPAPCLLPLPPEAGVRSAVTCARRAHGRCAQSGPTLCNPTHCGPRGSSVRGKNTEEDCHLILPIQGSNPPLPWQVGSLSLSQQGSPLALYCSVLRVQ